MINVGLLTKTIRDDRGVLLPILLGVLGFPILLVHAFNYMPWESLEPFFKLPYVSAFIRMLAGADLSEVMNITALGAFAFVHPVMLALTWAYITVAASRVLAAEIEVGTADLLLALPVSRLRVYGSVTLWTIGVCPLLAGTAWLGIYLGDRTDQVQVHMVLWNLRWVAVNFAAMLLAVTGLACLVSAACTRRGSAVGFTFGILLASFLLNWLANFWDQAQRLAVVGLLHYFRPFVILRDGPQGTSFAVLLGIAASAWTAGAFIFCRRDIPAR